MPKNRAPNVARKAPMMAMGLRVRGSFMRRQCESGWRVTSTLDRCGDTLPPRIDVEASIARESDQRQAGRPRRVHGQARRRADSNNTSDTSRTRLLHDLERHASAYRKP